MNILLCFLVVLGLFIEATSGLTPKSKYASEFNKYKLQHNKKYSNESETTASFKTFSEHLSKIDGHNSRKLGFEVGLNKYADIPNDKFNSLMNGFNGAVLASLPKPPSYLSVSAGIVSALPTSVDWRTTAGVVSTVKDQLKCGSCWAFASTGALESQNAIKKKKTVLLSEQNLIDCSVKYGNGGCSGGLMEFAYDYTTANNGIDTSAFYPYVAVMQKRCLYSATFIGAKTTGYVHVAPDELSLQLAVATIGPVAAAIDASQWSFQVYKGGVYNEPLCTSNLNHAVLIVGYGVLNGVPYWLVKNSWGTSWGISGYIMMSRNNNNQCGIADYTIYPKV